MSFPNFKSCPDYYFYYEFLISVSFSTFILNNRRNELGTAFVSVILSGRRGKVAAWYAKGYGAVLYFTTEAQGVRPCKEWVVTASQLDLPYLTLHAAGCGRLQLGVTHWVTSVALQQVVDN